MPATEHDNDNFNIPPVDFEHHVHFVGRLANVNHLGHGRLAVAVFHLERGWYAVHIH